MRLTSAGMRSLDAKVVRSRPIDLAAAARRVASRKQVQVSLVPSSFTAFSSHSPKVTHMPCGLCKGLALLSVFEAIFSRGVLHT
jgi:hypothetical protein